MKKFSFIILIIFIISTGNAEDDKNYLLRKKIVETQKKIEEFKKKSDESEKQLREFNDSHAKRLIKRKSDISKIKTEVSKLEKDLKEEKFKSASLNQSVKNNEIQFSMFKSAIKKCMQDSEKAIKNFPYNIEERGANISKLILDSEFESIAAEEIFNRYYNFLNRELLTGMDSEVFVKDNIKYLRIGWMILCYSDDINNEEGVLITKNGKWEWETNLDFSMRKAIRDSIKMVEGKKAPDLIQFPVPLSLLRKSIKGDAK